MPFLFYSKFSAPSITLISTTEDTFMRKSFRLNSAQNEEGNLESHAGLVYF